MNKAGIALGAAVLIIAIGGAAYTISRSYHPSVSPPESQSGNGNASVGASGASSIATYTDEGFSPSPISVGVGTTVTWSNQSSHPLWIEGMGTTCPSSGALNECASVSTGGTYSYTFRKLGTVSYTNHERTSDTGTVTVTEAASAGPINPHAIPE